MADPQRILVVQPNWVGDAVMATPALRALRALYPKSRISYLLRRYVKPVYQGLAWADELITYRAGAPDGSRGKDSLLEISTMLRSREFDLAILLPNSFKAALICKLARIPRIVGYDRDGRGFLLTDKLLPAKENGRFIPTPIVKYYLGLVNYLGSPSKDLRLELAVTPAELEAGRRCLESAGLDPNSQRHARSGEPWVILNPGAQYGSSKCWPTGYFAQLGDDLAQQLGARILLSGSPKEQPILDEISGRMKTRAVDLSRAGIELGSLKEVIRRCDLMVTNDTGPRHIAAAFGVPLITLFGPTHPEWTEIYFSGERKLSVPVFCGPCQKKKCPLDHRCMVRLTPAMVLEAARSALGTLNQAMTTGATQLHG
jgi:heptosyltransferase-2